jgi:hypothetical protein
MSNDFSLNTAIGPRNVADGEGGDLRQARDGGLVVSQSHGKHYEQTSRGNTFAVSGALTGTTIAAGHVAPPAAAAATTLSLLNPVGSGKNLEILKGSIAHVSGIPGAGSFAWCSAFQQATVTAGEANAIKRCQFLSKKQGVALAWSATALTGGAVHEITRVFPASKFAGAIDVVSAGLVEVDDVDGAIVVPPGWMITLAPPATGTTHIVVAQIVYAEVDIQS